MRPTEIIAMTFVLLLWAAPTAAQEAAPSDVDPWQACAAVAIDPTSINAALERYEVVFGKDTLLWEDEDFQQVIDLAAACDGAVAADGTVVNAREWGKQIEDAKEDVWGLIGIHRTIMRHANAIGGDDITLPICKMLLDYTQDEWAFSDNTKEIFGHPFMAMTDRDLERVVDHANHCLAFLPEFNKKVLGGTEISAKDTLYAIMDRALYIKKRREDWKFWQNKRPATDVMLVVDDVEILPTFTNQATRKLINRYNRALSFPGGLSLDTISALISIADDIITDNPSAFDVGYANEVKRLVQQGIFDRTEHKLE